ncbi:MULTISPECIES: hypothetical protein [unclassified Rhizobacter]|uniref:hypothetical protein n=1 Tax=unclassified Rhizobacter TaxID=2640088 RepID=UPI0006F465F5|nr:MULTISPECIES: hypothetical protein [unclassified Rhizobacter]KQU80856.1 plasmid replication/partition related protein [Rhizobacter sp. Root29]KQW04399.1 plasmid replication/partition related protein [Rhizobacter sp. Root1238]KRB14470.1 plasmid replication/partition related protein [Rhizobacter sp. Root16D2]
MDLVVNEELKAYIDPLTPDEHDALERSILAEGCRDALVLWGDMLVDGHNRYGICRKHGLPFQTVQSTRFQSLEDVHLWMIDQHLGRRSLSDYQRGVLALRKREIVAGQRARRLAEPAETASPAPAANAAALDTREALAKAARISSNQVVLIEKIRKQAAPELVEAIKAGTISINAAAAVASLPAEEQVAAAAAGKDELKQAAKRARDSRRRAPADDAATTTAPPPEPAASEGATDTLEALQQRVAVLTAENAALKLKIADLHAQLRANAGEADIAPF